MTARQHEAFVYDDERRGIVHAPATRGTALWEELLRFGSAVLGTMWPEGDPNPKWSTDTLEEIRRLAITMPYESHLKQIVEARLATSTPAPHLARKVDEGVAHLEAAMRCFTGEPETRKLVRLALASARGAANRRAQ